MQNHEDLKGSGRMVERLRGRRQKGNASRGSHKRTVERAGNKSVWMCNN